MELVFGNELGAYCAVRYIGTQHKIDVKLTSRTMPDLKERPGFYKHSS